MSGHPLPEPAPPAIPRCVRCRELCPYCTTASLPDGWSVVQFGGPHTAVVDGQRDSHGAAERIARQVTAQLGE